MLRLESRWAHARLDKIRVGGGAPRFEARAARRLDNRPAGVSTHRALARAIRFFDAHEWGQVRLHLRPDFRDAADFAFLTGWREMEVLALTWSNVEERAGLVKLDAGSTKSGAARVLPFADYPQVAEVIERRRAVAKRLAGDALITPWVFCFAEPLKGSGRTYRAAGAPLFRADRDRGLQVFCAKSGWLLAERPDSPAEPFTTCGGARRATARRRNPAQRRAPTRRLERQDLQPLHDRRGERA